MSKLHVSLWVRVTFPAWDIAKSGDAYKLIREGAINNSGVGA